MRRLRKKKRQCLGLKTVGRGPSAADRSEKEAVSMIRAREASADAIQQIVEEAETMIDRNFELEADDIENAQQQFKINTKDTQRADKKKIRQNKRVNKLRKEKVNMWPKNKRNYSMTRLKEFTWIYFSVIPP